MGAALWETDESLWVWIECCLQAECSLPADSGSAQMAVPPQCREWKGLSCAWEELALEINNLFATIKLETSVSSSR